jgi:hypothetical protein
VLCLIRLNYCHDSPLVPHLGSMNTYFKICKDFYWPGMVKEVRTYVHQSQS